MPIVFFTLYFYCAHYGAEPEEEADWALQASAVHQSLFFLLSHMHDPAPVLVAQLHTPVTIRLSRCIKAAFRLTGACPQMTLGKRRGIIFEVSPVNHMSWHIETNTLVLRHPRAILESPINPNIWREPRHAWPLCMVVVVSSGWIINI